MSAKQVKSVFRSLTLIWISLSLMILMQCKKTQEIEIPTPPITQVEDIVDNLHGVDISDPYRWLEDQESPETREWIDIQNEYTDSILGSLPGRRELKAFVSSLIKIDVIGVPTEKSGRYFFSKRQANQELSVIYMREGLNGEDQIVIDPHTMSEDKTISVTRLDVSDDGTLLAYGIRKGGEDELEVRLLDVDTKEDLPDVLPRARYFGIALTPDKKGFYYTRHDDKGPRIYYHTLGADITGDKEIFGSGFGPEMILFGDLSEDGHWLVITVMYGAAADKTEIYLKDLTSAKPVFAVVKDIPGRFLGEIADNTLFIQTNWEAPNQRIFAVDPKNPAQENWKEIIPEGEAVLQGFSLIDGKIFISYLRNVRTKVIAFEPDGSPFREISFPTIGTVSGVMGKWDSPEAFYVFTSFHIPTTIYRYDVSTGDQEVWAKIEVPVVSEKYEVEQIWYESKDNTRVPMFVVHTKDIKLDGSHLALLTGYGGFNLSRTPNFSSLGAAWLEKGGIFAVANLRGGGEFGEEWHRAGMLENKQNVFDDFIAAAEYLMEKGYTSQGKLAIRGSSNGGLLVGAAMTQRPDLFGAVICTYPLLDMIRYQKFLVAGFWVPEYGSSKNPSQFKYLHAYSPYHNVKRDTEYPAVLFITGDADTRVAPLHARKMTALVQASTGSDRPVMLRYHTKAGHSGGQPVSQQIEDLTETLSFLLWQLK